MLRSRNKRAKKHSTKREKVLFSYNLKEFSSHTVLLQCLEKSKVSSENFAKCDFWSIYSHSPSILTQLFKRQSNDKSKELSDQSKHLAGDILYCSLLTFFSTYRECRVHQMLRQRWCCLDFKYLTRNTQILNIQK